MTGFTRERPQNFCVYMWVFYVATSLYVRVCVCIFEVISLNENDVYSNALSVLHPNIFFITHVFKNFIYYYLSQCFSNLILACMWIIRNTYTQEEINLDCHVKYTYIHTHTERRQTVTYAPHSGNAVENKYYGAIRKRSASGAYLCCFIETRPFLCHKFYFSHRTRCERHVNNTYLYTRRKIILLCGFNGKALW